MKMKIDSPESKTRPSQRNSNFKPILIARIIQVVEMFNSRVKWPFFGQATTAKQGCQIFYGVWYQNRKMYQMNTNCTKWS
jgi:hypothetical protein